MAHKYGSLNGWNITKCLAGKPSESELPFSDCLLCIKVRMSKRRNSKLIPR